MRTYIIRTSLILYEPRVKYFSRGKEYKQEGRENTRVFSKKILRDNNQSNRLIIANAAFLLFLSSQSKTSLFTLLCSRFQLAKYDFPVCTVPVLVPVSKWTSGNAP